MNRFTEFMLTYGWAILIVLVVMFIFIKDPSAFLYNKQPVIEQFNESWQCIEWQGYNETFNMFDVMILGLAIDKSADTTNGTNIIMKVMENFDCIKWVKIWEKI